MSILEHIIKSFFLAIGLGVDSFSISLINGITYPNHTKKDSIKQGIIFSICQAIMPLTGYLILKYFSTKLTIISTISPYISLILLIYLGVKLIIDTKKEENTDIQISNDKLTISKLILQGIATSIDAISCSFSMVNLDLILALLEISIIFIITMLVSLIGSYIGKGIGEKVSKYSSYIGGIVLIIIGVVIFIRR